MPFIPKIEILPEAQKAIWPHLSLIPSHFTLFGGTAVALRYGHRESMDFDFFSNSSFDIHDFLNNTILPNGFSFDHSILGLNENHIVLKTTLSSKHPSFVKITLLNNPNLYLGNFNLPTPVSENGVNIASPIDLMANKILAFTQRFAVKDYIDIVEIANNGVTLEIGFGYMVSLAKRLQVLPDIDSFKKIGRAMAEKTVKEATVDERYLQEFRKQASLLKWEDIIKSNYELINIGNNTQPLKKKVPEIDINLEEYAKRIIWTVSEQKNFTIDYLLLSVMAHREYYFDDIKQRFGFSDGDFINALKKCTPGFFRSESMWQYWNWKLKIIPPLPYPRPGSLVYWETVFV